MSGKLLLDTGILVALFAEEAAVCQQIEMADEVFIPAIALGELYFAAYGTPQVRRSFDTIDQLSVESVVLGCDAKTARDYGSVKEEIWTKGTDLSENDLWIAALAIQHDLTLVTRNELFKRIKDVRIEVW